MARVAVIMPAYQAEAEIGEAIASVLAQTFADWQLVVVDDGSTDRTAEVARSSGDQRVLVLERAHTGLPAAARNAGVAATASEHVAFLDADDLWEPTKLERQLEVLDARPEAGLVYTYADHLVDGVREQIPWEPLADDALAVLAYGNRLYNSSVVVRRSLLERWGPLDEDPRLRGTEDYALWLRLAGRTELACVPERLLVYRVRAGGLSRDEPGMVRGVLTALELELEREPERFERLGPAFVRDYGIERFLNGLPGAGRRQLVAALRQDARDRRAAKWLLLSLLGRRFVWVLLRRRLRRAQRPR